MVAGDNCFVSPKVDTYGYRYVPMSLRRNGLRRGGGGLAWAVQSVAVATWRCVVALYGGLALFTYGRRSPWDRMHPVGIGLHGEESMSVQFRTGAATATRPIVKAEYTPAGEGGLNIRLPEALEMAANGEIIPSAGRNGKAPTSGRAFDVELPSLFVTRGDGTEVEYRGKVELWCSLKKGAASF